MAFRSPGHSAQRQPYYIIASCLSALSGLAILLYAPAGSWWRTSAGGIVYVFFLYTVLRLIWRTSSRVAAAFLVALWASVVEMSQAFGITERIARLNLPAEILLGTTFQWTDFAGYAMGLAFSLTIERWCLPKFK